MRHLINERDRQEMETGWVIDVVTEELDLSLTNSLGGMVCVCVCVCVCGCVCVCVEVGRGCGLSVSIIVDVFANGLKC
jgi:hypothetical protein